MDSPPLTSSSPIEQKPREKELYHCTICGRSRHLAQFCRYNSNAVTPNVYNKNLSSNNRNELGSIVSPERTSNRPLYETRPYSMYRYMPKVVGKFANDNIVNGVDIDEYNTVDDETKAIIESICSLCNIPVGVIPLPSYNTSLGIMYTYVYILKTVNFGKNLLNYETGKFDSELGIYKISQIISQVFGVVTAYDPTNPATAYLEYNIAKKEIQNYMNNFGQGNGRYNKNISSSIGSSSSSNINETNSDEVDDSFTTDTPETDLSSVDDSLTPFFYNNYQRYNNGNNTHNSNSAANNNNYRYKKHHAKNNYKKKHFGRDYKKTYQKIDLYSLDDINNELHRDLRMKGIHARMDSDSDDNDADNDDDIEVLLPDLRRDDDSKKGSVVGEHDWSRENDGFWNEEMLLQKDWIEKRLCDEKKQSSASNKDPDKFPTGRPPQSPSLKLSLQSFDLGRHHHQSYSSGKLKLLTSTFNPSFTLHPFLY